MKQYIPGDTQSVDQQNLADMRAASRMQVAQTQQATAEDVASRKAGDVQGEGTLTKYRPTTGWASQRGAGPQPGGSSGAELGANESYLGGDGAPEPIGVIRGMKVSYAAKGTGPDGEVGGGPLPEFATRQRAMQSENQMADIGEYSPPNAEELALKHKYSLEEIEKKDKMSGGDQKEAAALRQANVGTFENAVGQEAHYYTINGQGKRVLDPTAESATAFYSSQVASGKMEPDEAARQMQQHVIPKMYNQLAGTPQLAARQVPAFQKQFETLYGHPLTKEQAANFLISAPSGDPQADFQKQLFVVKTLRGNQDIAGAQAHGLLQKPGAAPAAAATVPPGTAPAPAPQAETYPPIYDVKPALRTMFNPPAYTGKLPDLARTMLEGAD
jgi:hypothetical protein